MDNVQKVDHSLQKWQSKDLESYCAFDELDVMEYEEEVWNVGSEYETRWEL